MGNRQSFLEADVEEEKYNQAIQYYQYSHVPGEYDAELATLEAVPSQYVPLGPYNALTGTYTSVAQQNEGTTPSVLPPPIIPTRSARRSTADGPADRPSTPPQPPSPASPISPNGASLASRQNSMEADERIAPSVAPLRSTSSPAVYSTTDAHAINGPARRPTVHFSKSSIQSSPAVLGSNAPTPTSASARVPSRILKGLPLYLYPDDLSADDITAPAQSSSRPHQQHRERHRRSRTSNESLAVQSSTPPPAPFPGHAMYYIPGGQQGYAVQHLPGTPGLEGMYPGVWRPDPGYMTSQEPQTVHVGTIADTGGIAIGSGARRPYPNMAYAVGLHTQHVSGGQYHYFSAAQQPWIPPQTNFPLKTFRGSDHTVMYIRPSWDDERLLRELKKTYNKLRGFWRKWFSLKNVQCITMVLNTHSFIYPQRVGSASVSPHRNLRFRWCLNHPESQGGRYDFMRALTRRADYGIEFVERWQVTRLVIAIVLPLALSLLVAIIYTLRTGDVSSAFTIAGYMTSAYSVFLVLLGILNLVEF